MKLIVLFLGIAVLLLSQDKGTDTQQATNCSQNFGSQSRNNTGSIICYNVDKKLADQISQLVAASKRDGKTLREISDKLEILLKELQSSQPTTTIIQQAPNGINIGPGAIAPNAQVNNITTAQLNINPMSPGYGMLVRWRVPYQANPIVFLNTGERVDATAKRPGEVYVSVFLSRATQDDITDKQSKVDRVLASLRALSGVRVFYAPGEPAYTLVKHDNATTIGGSLTIDAMADSLYFFNPSVEPEARRIRETLGGESVIKNLQRRVAPPGQDGLYTDTLAVSGVDMELYL